DQELHWDEDGLARAIGLAPHELAPRIAHIVAQRADAAIDVAHWVAGRYRPTPTIVEAAQALYGGHAVVEISRSEAGAENLTRTADYVSSAIEAVKHSRRK